MTDDNLTLDDIRELCKRSWLHYFGWHDQIEQKMPNAPKLTHGLIGITVLAGELAIALELITEDGLENFQHSLPATFWKAFKDA